MSLEVQVVDADYIIENGEVVVRCFGKTADGENVLFLDRNFQPYLYAVPAGDVDIEDLKQEVVETEFENEDEELPVTEVDSLEMLDGDEEIEVLKIYSSIPANIPKLKDELWDLPEVKECREFDIPFYKRYLMDQGIRPGEWICVRGEESDSGEFDRVIDADGIETGVERDGEPDWYTLAFDLEVYQDEIIMASFYAEDFEKVLTTEEIDKEFVETVDDEEALLERFIKILEEKDVDILTGYNTDEFDFDVLRNRAEHHNITLSLGRDGERMKFNRRGRFKGARLKGRMHLDLYPFISHVLAPGLESETLDLDSVAEEVLGMKKDDLSWEEMKTSWREKEDLDVFADYALRDSELAFKLGRELLPQIIELSRITGLIPFDACRLTYGQLTENFLIREAYEREMLAANRPSRDERGKRRRQNAYEGGFVYTPEAGLHEDIGLFDFKSLYPTVMVSHNISPDTLNLDDCGDRFTLEEFDYNFCQDEQGFFPELVEGLVEDRSRIKEKMKELEAGSQEYKSLDNRQKAEKILANSFYGYLGYSGARWYSRECAEATTYLGREYIQDTIEIAEDMGFEVVYGDSLDYSRQIVVKNPRGDIEFIEIGEFVEKTDKPETYETIAWDEERGKAVFKPVKRAIVHDYEERMLRFDTNRGRTKVTPQHSVYKYEDGEIKLADAEQLEQGDCLVSLSAPPKTNARYTAGDLIDLTDFDYGDSELRAYLDTREFPAEIGECPYCQEEYYLSSHVYSQHAERRVELEEATSEYSYIGCKNAKAGKIPRFLELTPEFAWVLGFYCGDGSASIGDKQMISFGGQDKENIQRVKEFFDGILEDELVIIEDVDPRTGNKMYYYRVQRKSLVKFFVNGLETGIGCSGKKVPNVILNGDEELKKSFIEGYFEADGSKERVHDSRYNSESMRFSSKSPYLANQIQYILKQLKLGENRYGRKINDVSYKYRDDKPEIKSIRNTAPRKPGFAELNFTPARISQIKEVDPTKDRVYDLEVKGEHNFVDAEGLLLVHNTDSVFLKSEGLRDKIDSFLKEVNDELPEFMQLELEGVFKHGFFTSTESGEGAKKKYALLAEDGSMKITGFEQVRRDWSPVAKQTQKKVLRMVLEDEVKKAVEEVKSTVEDLRDGKIPVEDLRIYTTLTKKPENYESTAPHVEAAKKAIERGEDISPGTTIDYVVTRGSGTISSRAELAKYAEDYDPDYYIENQIVPASLRALKVFGYTADQLKGEGKQSGLDRFG